MWKNAFFLKHHFTLERTVFHHVLYYQHLSIARWQVSLYANNYFEWLPIMSSALKTVFSLVSQHMHKTTNLWKFELYWLRDNNGCTKHLSQEIVFFQMLDFETSTSNSAVSKSNSWKITPFSKTTPFQREPFLTTFYTINPSPLLVTK